MKSCTYHVVPDAYSRLPVLTPADIRDELKGYLDRRQLPGLFLTAVLEDKLTDAVDHARPEDLRVLPQLVRWLVLEVPWKCRGSRERVQAWAKRAGETA